MKISKKIHKNVMDSVKSCRITLTKSIIELLKLLGAEPIENVHFRQPILLIGEKTSTIFLNQADTICFFDERGDGDFFHLFMGDQAIVSSFNMSISELMIVYNEVYSMVKEGY